LTGSLQKDREKRMVRKQKIAGREKQTLWERKPKNKCQKSGIDRPQIAHS